MSDHKLGFKHVLIIGSVVKYRRGLAVALLKHLDQPRFSALDPTTRSLPEPEFNWQDIDLVMIDVSKSKAEIRSWYFDLPNKFSLPPMIFVDSHASVDDACDFIRAGGADYLDLRGLKRKRLARALIIGTAMGGHFDQLASASEKGLSEAEQQVVDMIQNYNRMVDAGAQTDNMLVVDDDPESTGLLRTVSDKKEPVAGEDTPTEEQTTVDKPADQPWLEIGKMSDKALPANDEQSLAAASNQSASKPAASDPPSGQAPAYADGNQVSNEDSEMNEPSEASFLTTGLMSILERNQLTAAEENSGMQKTGDRTATMLGQSWPFTHGDIEQSRATMAGYDILEFIGVGGTASVFRVRRQKDNKIFAMKLFDAESPDHQGRERFIRGYSLLDGIHHPNIVHVEELSSGGDHAYVVQEYLPGGDLKSRITDGVDRTQCAQYAAQIAAALQGAYDNQILHRDLKPSNVLFREDDSLALVDFGIAKSTQSDTRLTQEGRVVGTPYYISPEQATGGEVDHRSDLYALGVIMYEMLEGERPFKGGSSYEIMRGHVHDPIPALSNPSDPLNGLIGRLLAKKGEERFPSGRDMLNALKIICPNEVPVNLLL